MQTGGIQQRKGIAAMLGEKGYQVEGLSSNEMAKLHIRHLVGGHGPSNGNGQGIPDEVLYRFEFPERPGALMEFLLKLGERWNISLFHYRNHGADYGRVLVGIQVPPQEKTAFREFLDKLGYREMAELGLACRLLSLRFWSRNIRLFLEALWPAPCRPKV